VLNSVAQPLLGIVLGAVFVTAAVPKLRRPKTFVLAVMEYRVLPPFFSRQFARIAPSLELLLGMLLLTGTAVRLAAVAAVLLLTSFLIAILVNLARGRRVECNCFGSRSRRETGWGLVFQDLALAGSSLILLTLSPAWLKLSQSSLFRVIGMPATGGVLPMCLCLAVTVGTTLAIPRTGRRKVHDRSAPRGNPSS